MKTVSLRLAVALLALLPNLVRAQGEYSNWYFGQQAGLYFGPAAAPQPLLNGALGTPSACATLSDNAGNLLLYSNGDQVWNRLHQLVPGGSALGGNTRAAQGCTILRSPDATSPTAYIFTQRTAGATSAFSTGLPIVAEVPLAAGGSGPITRSGLPVVADSILQRLGDRLFAPYQVLVRHANSHDVWLLTRLHDQGVFLASLVDGTGRWPCARTVVSRVLPNRGSSTATWNGGITASADGRTLLYNDFASSLLTFDPHTGRVGPPLALALPAPTIPANINAYALGGTFSPNGQYLYLNRLYQPVGTTSGGSSAVQVLQYDLGAGTPAAVAQSGIEVYNVSNRNNAKNLPYHSQRGADGLIYFAVPDAPALDAILAPNARGRACRYTPAYLSLRGRLSAEALPGQLNDANLGPLLAPEAVAGCVGQPLLLRAGVVAGSGAANDSLRWWPGDGRAAIDTRASEDSLKVSYPAAGTYTLRVARRRQGVEIATATAMVRISPGPRVRLALAPDTAACAPLSLQLRVGTQPAGSTYRWQDGSTAATLVATAPGMYWVDVRAAAGCVARASVQVRELPCTVSATSLPTIITPNGDQLNQAFVLRGLDAPDWTLRVYNRWGREVFQQVSYDNRWEAQGQSDGGYFYQLRHRTTGQVLKGWVEVRR